MKMEIEDWINNLIGKKVSILIDGYRGKEAYTGVLASFDGEWLVVQLKIPDDVDRPVKRLFIRLSAVISIWEYLEEED